MRFISLTVTGVTERYTDPRICMMFYIYRVTEMTIKLYTRQAYLLTHGDTCKIYSNINAIFG